MHRRRAHVAARIAHLAARGTRARPAALIVLALALAGPGCGGSTRSQVNSTSPPVPLTSTVAQSAAPGGKSESAPASPPSTTEPAPAQTPTPSPAAATQTSTAIAANAACSAAGGGASRSVSTAQFAVRYALVTRWLGSLSRLHAAGLEGVRLGRVEAILHRLQSLYLRASRGGGTALRSAVARVERVARAAAIVAGARACAPPRTGGRVGTSIGTPVPGSAAPTERSPSRGSSSPIRPPAEGQP